MIRTGNETLLCVPGGRVASIEHKIEFPFEAWSIFAHRFFVCVVLCVGKAHTQTNIYIYNGMHDRLILSNTDNAVFGMLRHFSTPKSSFYTTRIYMCLCYLVNNQFLFLLNYDKLDSTFSIKLTI